MITGFFAEQFNGRNWLVHWPPRSYGITPVDYFMWWYVKSLGYDDKPQTFDHVEAKISCVIADVRYQLLEEMVEN